MYKIYFLLSEDRARTYVGFTDDLERRMKEHRRGGVKTTRAFGDFKGYVIDKSDSMKGARKLEKYYKSRIGRKALRRVLDDLVSKTPGPSRFGDPR